jgi:peroxin-4
MRECQEYEASPNQALLHLGPVSDDDLFHWEAVLKGVRGTPYDGGLWLLNITLSSKYPLEPPKIEFVTPICHPNIYFQTGEICLTLLTTEHWSPMYTLSSTMTAVQQLLTDPTPESPLNIDIANLYREDDRIGAEALVRFWTGEKRWAGEGKGGWISERRRGSGGKLGE